MTPIRALLIIIAAVAVILAAIYFIALPSSWPKPYITAEIQDSAKLGEDIPITITLHSWHENVNRRELRFIPAGYESSAVKQGSLAYPFILDRGKAKEYWGVEEVSRKTRPRDLTFNYTVPLSEFFYQGKLVEGTLKGRVDQIVDYPDMRNREAEKYPAVREIISCPFEIRLYE